MKNSFFLVLRKTILSVVLLSLGLGTISFFTRCTPKPPPPFGLDKLKTNAKGEFLIPKQAFLNLLSIPESAQKDIVLPNGKFIPDEIPMIGRDCYEDCNGIPILTCMQAGGGIPGGIICECNCIPQQINPSFERATPKLKLLRACGSEFRIGSVTDENICADCIDCEGKKTKCKYGFFFKSQSVLGKKKLVLMGKCECPET